MVLHIYRTINMFKEILTRMIIIVYVIIMTSGLRKSKLLKKAGLSHRSTEIKNQSF